jgi:hypothetical protein
VHVDQDWIERLTQKERREKREREIKKVAEQIGYLYIVGGLDQQFNAWREDIGQSNWNLVSRNRVLSVDFRNTETSEYSDEDETEDEKDSDEDETQDDEDSDDENETGDDPDSDSDGEDSVAIVDKMDIDDF